SERSRGKEKAFASPILPSISNFLSTQTHQGVSYGWSIHLRVSDETISFIVGTFARWRSLSAGHSRATETTRFSRNSEGKRQPIRDYRGRRKHRRIYYGKGRRCSRHEKSWLGASYFREGEVGHPQTSKYDYQYPHARRPCGKQQRIYRSRRVHRS